MSCFPRTYQRACYHRLLSWKATAEKKKHGLFCVPFSRAKTLDGVFLKSFQKSYVYCDPDVIKELHRLEETSTFKFSNIYLYDDYFYNIENGQPTHGEVKMCYINRNVLLFSNHFECLKNDKNLMAAQILCVAKTKLCQDTSMDILKIPNSL